MSSTDPRHCWPTDRDNSYERTILVCIPPADALDIAALTVATVGRLLPYLSRPSMTLCSAHLPVTDTTSLDAPVLADRTGRDGIRRCIAAPVSVLRFGQASTAISATATGMHRRWTDIVAGTASAQPWRHFIDRSTIDVPYSIEQAADDFLAQPRIHAIAEAIAAGSYPQDIDEFGPALQAHQLGQTTYTHYLANSIRYGDTIVTAEGDLILASTVARPRAEHVLAERAAYWTFAGQYLSTLNPDTLLVATHCQL